MNIVKAQQAIEQLRRMLSNSANEQDKNIFAKLKSDLAKDAPINLKNKILKLEYLLFLKYLMKLLIHQLKNAQRRICFFIKNCKI